MGIFLNALILIVLFLVLGLSADFAVKNIKYIALSLRLKMVVLGAILGIATTLPELSVGINAALKGVSGVSAGNILGGITVIIGLILGVSLILHKNISTEDNLKSLVPVLIIILSPFLLGTDGVFSLTDGLILIALYLALVIYLYKTGKSTIISNEGFIILEKKKIAKALLFSLLGIVIVLLSSSFIVEFSSNLLEKTGMSKLMLGILVFSIGTNLPEITIALTSWKRKASELSVSYLISSAFTNIFALGVVSIFKPITFQIGPAYYVLASFLALIMILFVIFSFSGKKLSRREGFVLLFTYLAFLAVNIFLVGK
ncbi:hypothetical protein JXK06_00780 [Patescibacteria group bacterium]|nr:hypothetical protein [Patescibacteria group bacterium]